MAFLQQLAIQGQLNRVLTHVIIPSFPQLTITASYMSKAQAVQTFEGPFVDQEPTATGIVTSPRPYCNAQVVINGLRSQSLSALWLAQFQTQAFLGAIETYSDSTIFPQINLAEASITEFDPGPFDGSDPTVKMTVKGIVYINSILWTGV